LVKNRRITEKDKKFVATFINQELKERKANPYRAKHEKIWKEVDRQVYMESMQRRPRDPGASNWRSAIELGELSRASEILTADIRNTTFPQNRSWFDPHAKIDGQMDDSGNLIVDPVTRKRTNGALRALMAQQHLDFGMKSRVDLSVKESLHHGGYVAEVKFDSMLKVAGDKVQGISAPTWVPHSMWKCYPESNFLGNMFYSGSMIIETEMKYRDFKKISGPGWFDIDKVKKKDDEDVCIIKYYGDVSIPRGDGDIYYPNSIFYAVEDRIVYYEANNMPYPRIIYNGYERLDVRDPYFISPLVKMSPTQKIASTLANNFIDATDRWVDPPIDYDGNDADLVAMGGPDTSPGAKNPRKTSNSWTEMKIGDPVSALNGAQFFMVELQKGTAVDAIRSGMTASTEQTATEVERTRQGAQLRTINFVDKHELQGILPFLYMQHELNKLKLKDYKFYNPEIDAPDFEIYSASDLPKDVQFDIVGSKSVLQEEQRQVKTMQVTQFWASIPATADKLNYDELIKDSYYDAGNKNPEKYLVPPQQEQMMNQQLQMSQQQIQQLQDVIKQMQQELDNNTLMQQQHGLENQQNDLEKEQLQTRIVRMQETIRLLQEVMNAQKRVSITTAQ